MNRIVRDHYPVSKLPEDLREGFGPDAEVRVTIDAGDGDLDRKSGPSLETLFARGRPSFASVAEIDQHLHALRGEWD